MDKPNLLDMYEELDEVESDITKTLNTLSGFFRERYRLRTEIRNYGGKLTVERSEFESKSEEEE